MDNSNTITDSVLLKKMFSHKNIQWTQDGEISIWNMPAMIFPVSTIAFLQKTLEIKYGDDVKHIMYMLGKLQAKMGAEVMYKKFGFKRNKDTIELSNQQSQLIGVGVLKLLKCDLEKKHFIISDENIPYARHYLRTYGLQREPVDHFIRGTIAGAYQMHAEDDTLVAIEKECVTTGKPACIFEIKPADKWDLGDPIVKSQFPKEIINPSSLGEHLGLKGLINQ